MISGHGGNIFELANRLKCSPFAIIDMSSNVNPLGPPSGLLDAIGKNLNSITALPEADSSSAIQAFSNFYNIDPLSVLAGNGTTQFIYMLPMVLGSQRVCIISPTYSDYEDACIANKVAFKNIILSEKNGFQLRFSEIDKKISAFDTIFICNPNNPTGQLIAKEKLEKLCLSNGAKNFIIDESYLPFVPGNTDNSMINSRLDNIVVLNSMSKIFKIPGLRIGFIVASKGLIERFKACMLPWSLNSLAQTAVTYLMKKDDEVKEFIYKTRNYLTHERSEFLRNINKIKGIKAFPSVTSFILMKLEGKKRASEICQELAINKFLIRNCSNFRGLNDRFIRISLKEREYNILAVEQLRRIIFR